MGRDSEIAEIGRAIKTHNKHTRDTNWDERGEAIKALDAEGFFPTLLNVQARHYRIKITGHGWVDFWPSSWKWLESPRPKGKRATRGHGLQSLLIYLRSLDH